VPLPDLLEQQFLFLFMKHRLIQSHSFSPSGPSYSYSCSCSYSKDSRLPSQLSSTRRNDLKQLHTPGGPSSVRRSPGATRSSSTSFGRRISPAGCA
jgi:hypothetical protein